MELLDSCTIGIHDISRTEFTSPNTLPRFNMPFELGLDYLYKKKLKPDKKILILDKKAYQYTKTISDLACLDVEHHDDNKTKLLNLIRKFFVNYFELTETASPQKLEAEFETEFLLWLNENLSEHQFENGISELEMDEYKLKVKKYFAIYPEKIANHI